MNKLVIFAYCILCIAVGFSLIILWYTIGLLLKAFCLGIIALAIYRVYKTFKG